MGINLGITIDDTQLVHCEKNWQNTRLGYERLFQTYLPNVGTYLPYTNSNTKFTLVSSGCHIGALGYKLV
jgi:hypothetical protein